ncbi:hypothetical protein AB0D35_02820 [Streptomyces sp. NPDC048301]|uniref:hypothetical protein n=1 Tax=unclassified Streptomyces TaxID=2593676 RepID=UPI0034155B4E
MAVDAQAEAHLAGRLYAVLAELQRLAEGEHHSLGQPEVLKKVTTHPGSHLTQHLNQAGKYLLAARNRKSGKQAAVLFRSIPDLLPTGRELPTGQRSKGIVESFHAGIAAQREEIAKAV